MKTVTFRLTPGLSGNKRSWCLERVETYEGGTTSMSSTLAWFASLKAAKAAGAHLARKPITLPHKLKLIR
jgi:hypothetical protein